MIPLHVDGRRTHRIDHRNQDRTSDHRRARPRQYLWSLIPLARIDRAGARLGHRLLLEGGQGFRRQDDGEEGEGERL